MNILSKFNALPSYAQVHVMRLCLLLVVAFATLIAVGINLNHQRASAAAEFYGGDYHPMQQYADVVYIDQNGDTFGFRFSDNDQRRVCYVIMGDIRCYVKNAGTPPVLPEDMETK